jgi:MoxR-like ATPase
MDPSPLAKLEGVRQELKAYFIERDEIVDGALAGLLAGEHVLLLGPVGTAKSLLARALCERIEGASYFGWLLTKFSTPEEIFGPVSLQGLERDEFRRITTSKLPSAHIAFLDEIFKANSAILNSLLAVLNERVYHNGRQAEPVPLLTLFAASNELPEEGELLALYDRFLLRFRLDYIADDVSFLKLLKLPGEAPRQHTLRLEELRALQALLPAIEVSDAVLRDVAALRTSLNEMSIEASDRRYKKALDVLRAYALLEGKRTVLGADLVHLEHVLWSDPAEQIEIQKKILEVGRRYQAASEDLVRKAREQHAYATRYWPSKDERVAASVESLAKLKRLLARAQELLLTCQERKDGSADQIGLARDEIAELIDDLLGSVGGARSQ